ncbi:twin-arginine translocase TatA/TatE family subunit [soil metagenome]
MGAMQPIHWIIVAVLALLLFGGRGKLSSLMGDAAKGVRAFKEGLKNEDEAKAPPAEPAAPLPRAEKEQDPIVR